MKFNIEYFKNEHYEELKKWWSLHNHPAVPFSSLPYGIVVSNEKQIPVCMSFLYTFEISDMCQIGWTTTNPNTKLRERYECVDLALDSLLILAQKLNKKTVICFSTSRGISKLMNKKGLSKGKSHDIYIGSF